MLDVRVRFTIENTIYCDIYCKRETVSETGFLLSGSLWSSVCIDPGTKSLVLFMGNRGKSLSEVSV